MSLPSRATDFEPEADAPACQVLGPDEPVCPVVFSSPHSGRLYPAEMMALARLDERAIRQSEDAFVDDLIAPAVDHGVTLVLAGYARAYVDVNREPDEIDPLMFEGGGADGAGRTARVAAGLGCIPRVVAQGREIYRGKLPADEAQRRLARVWRPYHVILDARLTRTRARFGRSILIDWHSMPTGAASAGGVRGGRAPDIVLGDRFGRSCAAALTGAVQRELERAGYVVARNTPYAGGWTTERYGRPEQGLHALQIEICRGLYLDEARLAPSAGFDRLRQDVGRLAQRLAATPLNLR